MTDDTQSPALPSHASAASNGTAGSDGGISALTGQTIAITGATGKLAGYLIPILEQQGASLLLFSREPAALKIGSPHAVRLANDQFDNALSAQEVDVVIDLAVLNNRSGQSVDDFHAVNVTRFKNVVTAAKAAGVGKVLAFSSYHALDPDASSAYARSKAQARRWALEQHSDLVSLLTLPKIVSAAQPSAKSALWRWAGALKPIAFRSAIAPAVIDHLTSRNDATETLLPSQGSQPLYRFLSRTIDIGFALSVMLLAGWIGLIVALLIKLDSRGPAIFAQTRVGKDERPFTLYKFRTMAVGTRQAGTHEITSSAVTRTGGWLRRFKLDELPQVVNILKGDLALVGPRPCLPNQTELVARRREHGIFQFRPGLTGMAQVAGIDMSNPARLVDWEWRYLQIRGLALDIRIILQTFLGKGSGDRTKAD